MPFYTLVVVKPISPMMWTTDNSFSLSTGRTTLSTRTRSQRYIYMLGKSMSLKKNNNKEKTKKNLIK